MALILTTIAQWLSLVLGHLVELMIRTPQLIASIPAPVCIVIAILGVLLTVAALRTSQ
jgi:hypothetical protein